MSSSQVPSPASREATSDAPTHHWDELGRRLDDFLAAWEKAGGKAPALADFLPAEPLPLRRLVLAELIKADL